MYLFRNPERSFKERRHKNPQFIPNQRQIDLLLHSGNRDTLSSFYQSGLINRAEFAWSLSLNNDPNQFEDLIDWTLLNDLEREINFPVVRGRPLELITSEMDQLPPDLQDRINWNYTFISAFLALTDNQVEARRMLMHKLTRRLIQLKGKLDLALRLDEDLYSRYQHYFNPLSFYTLDPFKIKFVVHFPLNQFNPMTLNQLKQLSIEDNQRFNQLFSVGLAATPWEYREILNSSFFLDLGFNSFFYPVDVEPMVTPRLYYFNYSLTQAEISTDRQSSNDRVNSLIDHMVIRDPEQKDLWTQYFKSAFGIGVTLQNYSLFIYLNLIVRLRFYLKIHKLDKDRALTLIGRSLDVKRLGVDEQPLIYFWIFDYLDRENLAASRIFQGTSENNRVMNSFIDLLVVNQDQRLFQLPSNLIPLQSFLQVLTYNTSSYFCSQILNHFQLQAGDEVSIRQSYQFYDDPSFPPESFELGEYNQTLIDQIWSLLSSLGSTYDRDYYYDRFIRRLYDQNTEGSLKFLSSRDSIYSLKDYYLDWLKKSVQQDQANFLLEIEAGLEPYYFELEIKSLLEPSQDVSLTTQESEKGRKSDPWKITTTNRDQLLQAKIKDQAQELSSLIRSLSPYVADQIDLISTNFDRVQLSLLYKNLGLPWRQNYIDFSRDQLALSFLVAFQAKYKDQPNLHWEIINILDQILNLVSYVRFNFDQLNQTELAEYYDQWSKKYQEIHSGQKILFELEFFDFQSLYGSLRTRPLYQMRYGQIGTILSSKNLIAAAKLTNSKTPEDPRILIDYLNQVPLSYVLAELFGNGYYDFYYYLVDLIKNTPHLERRVIMSLFYLGAILSHHTQPKTIGLYRSIFRNYLGQGPPNLLDQYVDTYFTLYNRYHHTNPIQGIYDFSSITYLIERYLSTFNFDPQLDQFIQSDKQLATIDPHQIITPETIRSTQILLLPIYTVNDHELQVRLHYLNDNSEFRTKAQQVLVGPTTDFETKMARLYSLVDYGNLEEVLPVFKNLVFRGQVDDLNQLVQRIPKAILEDWIPLFKRAFRYEYRLEQTQNPDRFKLRACFTSVEGLEVTQLIQIPDLVGVLRVLIENYQFNREDFLSLFYELIQAMILRQSWDLLEVLSVQLEITHEDLLATSNLWIESDPSGSPGSSREPFSPRSRAEVMVDLVTLYGQPQNLGPDDPIQRYYLWDRLSDQLEPNYQLFNYIHYQRIGQILDWYQSLGIPIHTSAQDFVFVMMLELDSRPQQADQIFEFIKGQVTNQEIFELFTCSLNLNTTFYEKYYSELTDPQNLNWTDPVYRSYLLKLFKQRALKHLKEIHYFFNFGIDQLIEALEDNFLNLILEQLDLNLSSPDNRFRTIMKDQLVVDLLNYLHLLGFRKHNLLEDQPHFLDSLAKAGLMESLVNLYQVYQFNKEDLRELHNTPLILAAKNSQFEVLRVFRNLYGLDKNDLISTSDQTILSAAIIKGDIELLKFYYQFYNLTGDDLREVGTFRIFNLVIKYRRIQILSSLHQIYGLTRQDLSRSNLILAFKNGTPEIAQVLYREYVIRLSDLGDHLEEILKSIGEDGKIYILKVLVQVYGLNRRELKRTGLIMVLLTKAIRQERDILLGYIHDQLGFGPSDFSPNQIRNLQVTSSRRDSRTQELVQRYFLPETPTFAQPLAVKLFKPF